MASGTNATLIYYIKVYYMYIKVLYHIGFMVFHVDFKKDYCHPVEFKKLSCTMSVSF